MDYAYKISLLDIETEQWIPAKIKKPGKNAGLHLYPHIKGHF